MNIIHSCLHIHILYAHVSILDTDTVSMSYMCITSGCAFMSARDQRIQAADSLLQGPLHPLEESQRHVLWHSRWRNATEFGSFGLRNHLEDIDSSGILIDFPRCPSQKAHKSHTLLAVDDHLSPEEPMPAVLRIALRKVEAFHRAGIPLQLISEDPEIVGDVLLHAYCAPYSWTLMLVCYRSLVILFKIHIFIVSYK